MSCAARNACGARDSAFAVRRCHTVAGDTFVTFLTSVCGSVGPLKAVRPWQAGSWHSHTGRHISFHGSFQPQTRGSAFDVLKIMNLPYGIPIDGQLNHETTGGTSTLCKQGCDTVCLVAVAGTCVFDFRPCSFRRRLPLPAGGRWTVPNRKYYVVQTKAHIFFFKFISEHSLFSVLYDAHFCVNWFSHLKYHGGASRFSGITPTSAVLLGFVFW